jgi:hypothetical protein
MTEEEHHCDVCDDTFESEEELERHLRRTGIVE